MVGLSFLSIDIEMTMFKAKRGYFN